MLKITNRCNNRCIFCCDRKSHETIKDLNIDAITKCLDEQKQNFEVVHVIGGEPTMHPNFKQLIVNINNAGYKEIVLETNASLLNQPLINFLLNNKVKTFIVGSHTTSDQLYFNLTGNKNGLRNSFNGIKKTILSGGKVIVNIAVQKKNYKELKEIVASLNAIGVNDFVICSVIPPLFLDYSREEIFPVFSDIYPYILDTITSYKQVNFTLQYFPYCVIKNLEIYRNDSSQGAIHYIDINGILTPMKLDWTSHLTIKREECIKCKYNNVCNGVFKEYIDFMGWDEFLPVINEIKN